MLSVSRETSSPERDVRRSIRRAPSFVRLPSNYRRDDDGLSDNDNAQTDWEGSEKAKRTRSIFEMRDNAKFCVLAGRAIENFQR